jgi:hypothetical protein
MIVVLSKSFSVSIQVSLIELRAALSIVTINDDRYTGCKFIARLVRGECSAMVALGRGGEGGTY